MAVHTHFDVAFLMKDDSVHIGRTNQPHNFILKHVQGRIKGTAGRIVKVIGYCEVTFDTDDEETWATTLMDKVTADVSA